MQSKNQEGQFQVANFWARVEKDMIKNQIPRPPLEKYLS
jgi:hypothetical protein